MTDTYIDNDSRAAYTVDGNRFPPNLDNRSEENAVSDVFNQIGVNMMQAFIQTMMGTQHLRGENANDIASTWKYMKPAVQMKPDANYICMSASI